MLIMTPSLTVYSSVHTALTPDFVTTSIQDGGEGLYDHYH